MIIKKVFALTAVFAMFFAVTCCSNADTEDLSAKKDPVEKIEQVEESEQKASEGSSNNESSVSNQNQAEEGNAPSSQADDRQTSSEIENNEENSSSSETELNQSENTEASEGEVNNSQSVNENEENFQDDSESVVECSNYRKAMREFIINISQTARKVDSDFIVIPQNGQNVAWDDDDAEPLDIDEEFFAAIDGCGREDTFYGMNASYDIADGTKTPKNISEELLWMCEPYIEAGLTVLSTDYTTNDKAKIKDSFAKNAGVKYVSFAATDRNLSVIPDYEVYNKNNKDINKLSDAKNFLYLINPEKYTKKSLIKAIKDTDYDAVILDLFCDDEAFTKEELDQMKTKKNGGKRLLICYMSIGEAETYRHYWQSAWKPGSPNFLCEENADWEGNFKVRYWYKSWQNVICGKNGYLSKIVEAGFDGVYLDIVDAFEYFEEM